MEYDFENASEFLESLQHTYSTYVDEDCSREVEHISCALNAIEIAKLFYGMTESMQKAILGIMEVTQVEEAEDEASSSCDNSCS